jgi:hypothetical protein
MADPRPTGIQFLFAESSTEGAPSGAPPQIDIALDRNRFPRKLHSFAPIRMPDLARVDIRGELPQALRQAEGNATLRFAGGTHLMPLAGGKNCELLTEPGAKATARFAISPAEGSDSEPVLRWTEISFDPPLRISNLLTTLSGVHELLDDHMVAKARSLQPQLAELLRLATELANGPADSAITVLLDSATLQLREGGPVPKLRASFSGRVRFFDRLYIPFKNIFLPAPILPVLHASLTRLLSPQPFITADLQSLDDYPSQLTQAFLGLVVAAHGEISAEVAPPVVKTSLTTNDGSLIEAQVEAPPLTVQTSFAANISDDGDIAIRADEIRVIGTGCNADLFVEGNIQIDAGNSVDMQLEGGFKSGSRLPSLVVDMHAEHPFCIGGVDASFATQELEIAGRFSLEFSEDTLSAELLSPLNLNTYLKSTTPLHFVGGMEELELSLQTRVSGAITPKPEGELHAALDIKGDLDYDLKATLPIIPELDIRHGNLSGKGKLAFDLHLAAMIATVEQPRVDCSGTTFGLSLDKTELVLDRRKLQLPVGTEISGIVVTGGLSPAGLTDIALNWRWDLHGEPCLLHFADRAVSLLSDDLRSGNLTLELSDTGKLNFSGNRDGLYGVRYFNALVNPAADPEHLLEILGSDDALGHVNDALEVFSPQLAEWLSDLRILLTSLRGMVKAEGIEEPGDILPRPMIAKMLSLILIGDGSLAEPLKPIIQQATEADGLPVAKTKQLLQEHLGDFDIDYELGMLLSIANLILSPGDPISPLASEELPPLVEDHRHTNALQCLPSAKLIYERLSEHEVDDSFLETLVELAPMLNIAQLSHILEQADASWNRAALQQLHHVMQTKIQVEKLRKGYGGIEHGPQPLTINTYLLEVVGPLTSLGQTLTVDDTQWPPPTALGPEEVATLLQAGLAAGRQGRLAQINNRLLLELMLQREASFTKEVFIELGHQSPRALAGILYAFLDQNQDQMVSPLDLAQMLEEKLDCEIPKQSDYMAGGRLARESYYAELHHVADQIIAEADSYLAKKQHLQLVRHDAAPIVAPSKTVQKLAQKAQESIAKADELGRQCDFSRDKGGPRQRARKAYDAAFRACSKLLSEEPRAYQEPFFRDFWARNEEALRILVSVRAHQEDLDEVRRWLTVVSPKSLSIDGEQSLLQAIVKALYYREDDQKELLADPLVRLLIDPPPGEYDFSIVSCMGVITEGEAGGELEDAYRRLEERRGIRILRAPTGTGRSLEYNAERIIETIEKADSPWGIIGYSQGCANALLVESLLRGGTPKEQQLLDSLVCRNLLFSAANGSPHGSIGMQKFTRVMVHGERFLKHYQSIFSWEAIRIALRLIGAALDSPVFIHALGGSYSLTVERAIELHRDGQFLDHVPTSSTRAVVTLSMLPEALEYLYYMLNSQTGGAENDTQVLIGDAVGHCTLVHNKYTETLKRADIPSRPQSTHHWAPLTKEVEFVTTDRDIRQAVYQSPKDQLVWPWVEVNARFGRIARRRS